MRLSPAPVFLALSLGLGGPSLHNQGLCPALFRDPGDEEDDRGRQQHDVEEDEVDAGLCAEQSPSGLGDRQRQDNESQSSRETHALPASPVRLGTRCQESPSLTSALKGLSVAPRSFAFAILEFHFIRFHVAARALLKYSAVNLSPLSRV